VVRTTDSDHPFPRYPNRGAGLRVVRPDQVWVGDIPYIRLWTGFVCLAVRMDVLTRAIRGWHPGRYLDKTPTLTALQRAPLRATPDMHHSAQGVRYAASAYIDPLITHRVAIPGLGRLQGGFGLGFLGCQISVFQGSDHLAFADLVSFLHGELFDLSGDFKRNIHRGDLDIARDRGGVGVLPLIGKVQVF
jgi:hypothetical protein